MTDTPTKQEIQSKNDNVPAATPVEQKKNNRNDRKRNRRGDSKNLERDSDWQERVVQIRRVSKTVKGCLLYTSPSPRDPNRSRMPSSA